MLDINKSNKSSQSNYCLLVWTCNSRKMNNKIDKVYERALKIVYGHFKSIIPNN